MRHIKQVLAIILTAALVFGLSSCSLVSTDDTDVTNDNIKIGILLDDTKEATIGNAGVNVSAIREVTSLGYGIGNDRFKYAESVDPADADAVATAFKTLVNFECNIIFVTDPGYMDDVKTVADNNELIQFFVFNGEAYGENVHSYKANITGAAYLSGIAAGMKAAELKVPQIGFLAEKESDLTTLNAFANGAKSVYADVSIKTIIGMDAAVAAQKLITDGCVVLASDYENEAIAKAALENKIFFCGFGTEAFAVEDYATSYLCSPLYDFTQFYIDSIKAIVDSKDITDYSGGYISGATFISDLNDKTIASGTKEAVSNASTSLSKGELKFEVSALIPSDGVTIIK